MKNRQRKSLRLKHYDYSQCGAYFITVCTQNREHRFGAIVDRNMLLNDAGYMIEKWYFELENKFSGLQCDACIIMPNHVHFVVVMGEYADIGEFIETGGHAEMGGHVGPPLRDAAMFVGADLRVRPGSSVRPDSSVRTALPQVMQWFKTMTTNAYINGVKNLAWPAFDKKLWQRNYYEHIVRDEVSLHGIREYINSNPLNWQYDDLNDFAT